MTKDEYNDRLDRIMSPRDWLLRGAPAADRDYDAVKMVHALLDILDQLMLDLKEEYRSGLKDSRSDQNG
jgi:hypothetical protein